MDDAGRREGVEVAAGVLGGCLVGLDGRHLAARAASGSVNSPDARVEVHHGRRVPHPREHLADEHRGRLAVHLPEAPAGHPVGVLLAAEVE